MLPVDVQVDAFPLKVDGYPLDASRQLFDVWSTTGAAMSVGSSAFQA